jgi:hypothetical protein
MGGKGSPRFFNQSKRLLCMQVCESVYALVCMLCVSACVCCSVFARACLCLCVRARVDVHVRVDICISECACD